MSQCQPKHTAANNKYRVRRHNTELPGLDANNLELDGAEGTADQEEIPLPQRSVRVLEVVLQVAGEKG